MAVYDVIKSTLNVFERDYAVDRRMSPERRRRSLYSMRMVDIPWGSQTPSRPSSPVKRNSLRKFFSFSTFSSASDSDSVHEMEMPYIKHDEWEPKLKPKFIQDYIDEARTTFAIHPKESFIAGGIIL